MLNPLTDAQLKREMKKCEYCEEKPCKKACPADCSPADFMMAAQLGSPADYQRAASLILANNPLGGVCGVVCPNHHCMKACVHRTFDHAVNIPAVQATIIHKAKTLKKMPLFHQAPSLGKTIAIVGGGPAGLAAAAVLAQKGYAVVIFEKEKVLGGKCRYFSEHRLASVTLDTDIAWVQGLGDVTVNPLTRIEHPVTLLEQEMDAVIVCTGHEETVDPKMGGRSVATRVNHERVLYAGDAVNGRTTVVEAVASGKNAAEGLDAVLKKEKRLSIACDVKSPVRLKGRMVEPVSLAADFFGRRIRSPFLLSSAPASDGYEPMKRAYQAGWAGGVMKTAFDHVPIRIPSEYMFVYNEKTYANCDNVSGHSLDRVCREIEKLMHEFPDRLTMGSTGGSVTGHDDHDRQVWQANTRKLERASSMGIEFSLSCPQGGDGSEGAIVSQNPALAAKIVDWVMEISDPEIPKLFKLTSAVTSIYSVVDEIRKVLAKYPNKKAGITLANSFPTLAFRAGEKRLWEEGVIAGMSGDTVKYISYLALANVSTMGMIISGNGGPMDYKAAADFLALGVRTVQFCSIVLKYGVSIIDELHSGLSYLLRDRGLKSVDELIGCALPKPVTSFMQLSSLKKIPSVQRDLCQHCGNCTRCPYMAISLDSERIPRVDPSRCIGCSLCVKTCFSQALSMRARAQDELRALNESEMV